PMKLQTLVWPEFPLHPETDCLQLGKHHLRYNLINLLQLQFEFTQGLSGRQPLFEQPPVNEDSESLNGTRLVGTCRVVFSRNPMIDRISISWILCVPDRPFNSL